jgi:hypothetical protein
VQRPVLVVRTRNVPDDLRLDALRNDGPVQASSLPYSHRPHRGLDLDAPERSNIGARVVPLDEIRRTAAVGGVINEYHGRAA